MLTFLILPFPIAAEITITPTSPDFADGVSAQLQAMVEENIIAATDDVAATLNNLLDKPVLTGAFSSAAASGASLPLQGTIARSDASLSLGAYASFYSYTLDPGKLVSDFSGMTEEDDPEVGANAQLVHGGILLPAGFLPSGFRTGLAMAYGNMKGSDYFYRNLTFQGSLAYTPFGKIRMNRTFKWTPFSAQIAATYSGSEIGINLETGVITQEFEYEIDSSGFLPPEIITVELDPIVDVTLETDVFVLTADLSTGFSLLDFFHFYLGGGINVPWGRTDIGVETDEDFTITSNIIDSILAVDANGDYSTGNVVITGAVEGSSPVQFLPYCYTGLQVEMSRVYINLPIQYSFPSGLSSGLFMGVNL